MNEKIKELIEECTRVENGVMQVRRNETVYHFDKVKFAELIVRECVHVAVYKEDGMISTADVAGYMAAGRASAAKIIKEHFGVEE